MISPLTIPCSSTARSEAAAPEGLNRWSAHNGRREGHKHEPRQPCGKADFQQQSEACNGRECSDDGAEWCKDRLDARRAKHDGEGCQRVADWTNDPKTTRTETPLSTEREPSTHGTLKRPNHKDQGNE
jgi:hypothetical protein